MAVAIELIKPGTVFRFKNALRRVINLTGQTPRGCTVIWEYADGKKRGGRMGGHQWIHYFRSDAIEEVIDTLSAGETRELLPSKRKVACRRQAVDITLHTRCPEKWIMVDMETGQLWGHDGSTFRRLSENEAAEVAEVVKEHNKTP